MDRKTEYSNTVDARKKEAENDVELEKYIKGGEWRNSKYGSTWEKVSINDTVDTIIPNAKSYTEKGKMIYYSENTNLKVVLDIGGGYFRITSFDKNGHVHYYDKNGKEIPRNYTDERGKQHGIPKDKYRQLTHFKILEKRR